LASDKVHFLFQLLMNTILATSDIELPSVLIFQNPSIARFWHFNLPCTRFANFVLEITILGESGFWMDALASPHAIQSLVTFTSQLILQTA
jgi:hypothetical protein